ncbi:MAG: BMC domain-containing protein, partial [Defluviitaleaceae bacterium]|nr:BMC domain-containing protein [Defluviitaleaceae bacterium]
PHEGLLGAFYGTAKIEQIRALGVFETFDAATMIFAADAAAKTAIVDLIEIRLAKGMCGKSYATMTGEIAAITAAIDRAAAEAAKSGMHLDSAIIANPDKKLSKFLM